MIHARSDYNRIQDPALQDPSLLQPGSNPIAENEPVFLLRAGDATAAAAVRFWVALNAFQGDPKACELALAHAKKMEEWPGRKMPDA